MNAKRKRSFSPQGPDRPSEDVGVLKRLKNTVFNYVFGGGKSHEDDDNDDRNNNKFGRGGGGGGSGGSGGGGGDDDNNDDGPRDYASYSQKLPTRTPPITPSLAPMRTPSLYNSPLLDRGESERKKRRAGNEKSGGKKSDGNSSFSGAGLSRSTENFASASSYGVGSNAGLWQGVGNNFSGTTPKSSSNATAPLPLQTLSSSSSSATPSGVLRDRQQLFNLGSGQVQRSGKLSRRSRLLSPTSPYKTTPYKKSRPDGKRSNSNFGAASTPSGLSYTRRSNSNSPYAPGASSATSQRKKKKLSTDVAMHILKTLDELSKPANSSVSSNYLNLRTNGATSTPGGNRSRMLSPYGATTDVGGAGHGLGAANVDPGTPYDWRKMRPVTPKSTAAASSSTPLLPTSMSAATSPPPPTNFLVTTPNKFGDVSRNDLGQDSHKEQYSDGAAAATANAGEVIRGTTQKTPAKRSPHDLDTFEQKAPSFNFPPSSSTKPTSQYQGFTFTPAAGGSSSSSSKNTAAPGVNAGGQKFAEPSAATPGFEGGAATFKITEAYRTPLNKDRASESASSPPAGETSEFMFSPPDDLADVSDFATADGSQGSSSQGDKNKVEYIFSPANSKKKKRNSSSTPSSKKTAGDATPADKTVPFNFMSKFGDASSAKPVKRAEFSFPAKPAEPVPPKTEPPSTKTSGEGGWGKHMFAKAGQWKCETCFSRNDKDLDKCASCEAPRPQAASNSSSGSSGPAVAPEAAGSKNDTASSSAPGTTGAPKFTFGTSSDTSQAKAFSTSTAPQSTPAFTFGAVTAAKVDAVADSNSKPPTTTAAPEAGFKFDLASSPPPSSSAKPAEPMSSTPAFTFGASKPADDKAQTSSENAKSSSDTPAAPAPSFTFGASTAAPNLGSTTDADAAKLSAKKSEADAAPATSASPFTFGSAAPSTGATQPPSSTKAAFTFGAASQSAAPPSSSAQPQQQPAFTFGASSSSSDLNAAKEPESAKAPSIGNSNGAKQVAPAFTFGSGTAPVTNAAAAAATPTPSFSFGGAPTTTSTPGAAATPAAPKPFSFGASSSTPQVPASAQQPSSAGTFTFGQQQPTPSTPGLGGFNSSNSLSATVAPSTTPAGAFQFGGNASSQPSSTNPSPVPFQFGGGRPSNQPAPNPAFGGMPSGTPSFGGGVGGGPMTGFGNTSTAQTPSAGGFQPSAGGFQSTSTFTPTQSMPQNNFNVTPQHVGAPQSAMGAQSTGGFSMGTGEPNKKKNRRTVRVRRK